MSATAAPVDERPSVLLVDDAEDLRRAVAAVLSSAGFAVTTVPDGEAALAVAAESSPDIVVLDIGLPGIDGIETCRRLRWFSEAYVLMLSGSEHPEDKLTSLEIGADDYLSKPFLQRELVARLRAMMRRPRQVRSTYSPDRFQHGDLVVDVASREARVAGQPVPLTRIEFDLLTAIIKDPLSVVTRQELTAAVWGPDWVGGSHVIDVHIANLRSKIDDNGVRHLLTVRGVGYRMAPVSEEG